MWWCDGELSGGEEKGFESVVVSALEKVDSIFRDQIHNSMLLGQPS
jgi:hypothetical protein